MNPEGDHFVTRLTHTLQVTQVGRSLATALGLNEPLTEAICLGHEVGHPPFGHTGEVALSPYVDGEWLHSEQSVRVFEVLEPVNLSLGGARRHSGPHLEGRSRPGDGGRDGLPLRRSHRLSGARHGRRRSRRHPGAFRHSPRRARRLRRAGARVGRSHDPRRDPGFDVRRRAGHGERDCWKRCTFFASSCSRTSTSVLRRRNRQRRR